MPRQYVQALLRYTHEHTPYGSTITLITAYLTSRSGQVQMRASQERHLPHILK